MKIAIKSKKPLNFPPAFKDVEITMEIDLIQNLPNEEVYVLRILDKAWKEFDEEQVDYIKKEGNSEDGTEGELEEVKKIVKVKRQVGETIVRGTSKKYPYSMLNQLASQLKIDFNPDTISTSEINELFRYGLLFITQQECLNGEGMYFSEATDWEIIR